MTISGANQDDQGDWRPGLRAAAEHDVQHPLIDVTKEQVRERVVRALARQVYVQ